MSREFEPLAVGDERDKLLEEIKDKLDRTSTEGWLNDDGIIGSDGAIISGPIWIEKAVFRWVQTTGVGILLYGGAGGTVLKSFADSTTTEFELGPMFIDSGDDLHFTEGTNAALSFQFTYRLIA